MRLFVPDTLAPMAGLEWDLPPAAARHAQVRRVQPGHRLRLFDGQGVDWPTEVLAMTRSAVHVRLEARPVPPPAAELPWSVTLAFCMPANERVDALVEKATELGAAAMQPLMSERSVLRLADERAERRRAHWQAVAAAACEQCGRARLPAVSAVLELSEWFTRVQTAQTAPAHVLRWLLSTDSAAQPCAEVWTAGAATTARGIAVARDAPPQAPCGAAPAPQLIVLSGPEGGFSRAEELAARAAGFAPVSLGARVLRADTAPLAVLAWIALSHTTPKSS